MTLPIARGLRDPSLTDAIDPVGGPSASRVTVSADAATNAADRPDYQRPEYQQAEPARQLCRDLLAGSQAIHARGETYLPKWPAERLADYRVRAAIAHVTGYYQRTVHASVGMIVATPPKLADGADPLIATDWEDIDGQGTHGEVFAAHLATDAIAGGFCAVLVDAPPVPPGTTLSLADEQALGLRPFWVRVPAQRIVSWIVEVPDWAALLADYATGVLTAEQVRSYARQEILRQIVLHEPADLPQGAYGISQRDRYRVLRLTDTGVTFQVWERVEATATRREHFVRVAQGTMTAAGGAPFREIPLAVIYAGRKHAPFVAAPPLLALAELNLDHFQVTADRRYLMRLCHAPTLFLAGFQQEDDGTGAATETRVGPNSILRSSDPAAKASYVVADPGALNSSQEEKQELVRQMATLGMSFLGKDLKTAAETATGRQLDDAAENATHATVARALQDGLEQALRFHAQYRGVQAPEITVNTTYASPQVDPQIASLLWQAVLNDRLDLESWISYIRTGSLPDDIDIRLEVLRLSAALQPTEPTPPTPGSPPQRMTRVPQTSGLPDRAPQP